MNTCKVSFYAKKSKYDKSKATIYARVICQGKRFEISTGSVILIKHWNKYAGRVTGNSKEAVHVNAVIERLKLRILDIQTTLLLLGKEVTVDKIKKIYYGDEDRKFTIVEVFTDHNEKMKNLIGKSFSKGTWERYETSLRHTVEFMKWKYKVGDMPVHQINPDFVNSYEYWLRTVRGCANNSAVKYIKNFQKIINICISNEWITKNPFIGYKSKLEAVTPKFLTTEDLEKIYSKTFKSERLSIIRDLFIFSCYTGLAYIDLKNLGNENFTKGIDGNLWLKTSREKTKVPVAIPVLDIPMEILQKYSNHPKCLNSDKALPVPSNQKVNEYLKEISALCDLDVELTFHAARHTFATTVTLSNGVPLETVSRMLGHTNIRMTQHYAKVLDSKISADMQALKEKLNIPKSEAANA